MTLLKIDLDWKPPNGWLDEWIETRKSILQHYNIVVEYFKLYETSRGYHVYIKVLNDMADEDINKMQFLLGDDLTRVKINQWRIRRGIKRWNKLFHKVVYRKKYKTVKCYYCGSVIPLPD